MIEAIGGARGRYDVLRRIGIGGMAEVFLARERPNGRLVAMKRLLASDDGERLDLFLDEARIAARLVHPNIVQVHELGCDDLGLYLSLEYVAGRTLSSVLRRAASTGALSRRTAAWIVAEIATALAHVHAAEDEGGAPLLIVHRDVSPTNVLVSRDGDVKLTDFGIAKARVAAHRTRTGVVRGTTAYMSPEQMARRPVDARSDVWSAGVILWEATLCRRLFAGDDPRDLQQRIGAGLVTAPTQIDPDYPPELEAIVMAALDVDPARRPSAAQLERRLRGWCDGSCRDDLAETMRAWFGDELEAERGATATEPGATSSTRDARPGGPPRHRRTTIAAVVLAAVAGVFATAHRAGDAAGHLPAIDAAWRAAQHGGHEEARVLVDELLDAAPDDPEIATLAVLVHWWLGSRQIDTLLDRAEALPLAAARRALLRTIGLLHRGRADEAIAAARAAEARHPGSPEVAYALGEALWHGGARADGVAWLDEATRRDPSWRMALDHAVDYWAVHGGAAQIRAAAARIERADAAAAAGLRIDALIAERSYAEAADAGAAATRRFPHEPALWQRRADAELLAGDLAAATRSARVAAERWPVDDRDRGPRAVVAEVALARGDEAAFVRAVGGRFSVADVLRRALWHGGDGLTLARPVRPEHVERRVGDSAMSPPPMFECASLIASSVRGDDAAVFAAGSPHPEVRAYGVALAAERRGDLDAAVFRYADALDRATAATRPLFAYHLARVLVRRGDVAGAAAACDEVLRPRAPIAYRAVLVRDCATWTEAAPTGGRR